MLFDVPVRAFRRAVGALAASGVVLGLAGCASTKASTVGSTAASRTPSPVTRTGTGSASAAVPLPAPRPTAAQVRRQAAAGLGRLIRAAPQGGASVAAIDLATGRRYAAGASSGMWTASTYKLFLVEQLLLHRQGGGGIGLSSSEIAQCTTALENSDNVAGYELFSGGGGNPAMQQTASRLHMTHTDADGTDPAFLRTSAADYLQVLRALVDPDSPLSAASRHFVLHLMSQVEPDQRWGVGVVADKGTTFYNKNGWLSIDNSNGPGEDDGFRWVVSSVGIVTVHSHKLLLSVFTEHNPSFADGVGQVQALARLAASYVTGAAVN